MSATIKFPLHRSYPACRRETQHGQSFVRLTGDYLRAVRLEWRRRAEERARRRRRLRTAAIIAALPRQIRADIGWPGRHPDDD